MADKDFMIALELQRQFDEEYAQSLQNNETSQNKSSAANASKVVKTKILEDDLELALRLDRELNGAQTSSAKNSSSKLCHDSLELLDPNPDPIAMFVDFDKKYFWGKLASVEVLWSKKMTLCAGLCEYHGHKSGMCRIKLSEPLLKYRPRKDLVETLLHEMIHAYLFLTNNDRDRDGHGPEFLKHMRRLNVLTGLNVTIYHSFHNEVANCQQHWWQCDGPCKGRPPYFGMVKRAMNRAPSFHDPWWADHQRTCGGMFNKIKEPENAGKKRKLEESSDGGGKNKLKKLDDFFIRIDRGASLSQPSKLPSNVHTFSNLSNSLRSDGFGMKNNFVPPHKDNIRNEFMDRGTCSKFEEQRNLLNRKRKTDSLVDSRESSAKVSKFADANEDVFTGFVIEGRNPKLSDWPKSFASKLVISTLSQGEQQLRRNDLKIGETIDIPDFISVTNPKHNKFHKKKNGDAK